MKEEEEEERGQTCGGKSACDNDKGKGRTNVCGGEDASRRMKW